MELNCETASPRKRDRSGMVKLDYKIKQILNGTDDCGDSLAKALGKFLRVPDDDGKVSFSLDRLLSVAKENGVDPQSRWPTSNVGQWRMNLSNMLRGKWRRGETVLVNGKVVLPP